MAIDLALNRCKHYRIDGLQDRPRSLHGKLSPAPQLNLWKAFFVIPKIHKQMYILMKPLFKIGEFFEAMATTKLNNNSISCHDSVTDTNQSKL